MNVASAIKAARKLGNFIATLYPRVGALGTRIEAWVLARPTVARWRAHPRMRVVLDAVDRFWWSDYARDRVDWQSLPSDAVPLLRWLFTGALLLTLALPLAIAWPVPALAVPSACALALGLGFAMAAAAAANRGIAFGVELVALWLLASSAFGPPRSFANLLPSGAVLVNLAFSEARAHAGTTARLARALAIGAASGMVATILTPLAFVWPAHKLIFGAAWGAPLGVGVALAARRVGRAPSLLASAVVVSALAATHLGVVVGRAGLVAASSNWVDVYRLLLGWLWPVWYFVGVGVVFALLKGTRATIAVVDAFVPRRALAVVLGVALAIALALAWSRTIAAALLEQPAWLQGASAALFVVGRRVIWDDPQRSLVFGWLRWVLLADVIALVWLALRRRLTIDAWVALASTTGVITFGIHEYVSELFGFQRAQGYGLVLLVGFAIWLLWLLYKIGLRIGSASSPHWPASARLGLCGAVLVLALGAIDSRAAIGELKVIDEIFLYLFRGVVDIGVPFGLFVWAQRRLPRLPVETARLFFLFVAGALATLFMNLADQAAASGSVDELVAFVAARHASLSQTGRDVPVPALPLVYEVARDAILLAVGLVVVRRQRARGAAMSVMLFELAALALGYASFVRMRVDLPLLPMGWALYVQPSVPPQFLDGALVTSLAAWLVPVLALSSVRQPLVALLGAGIARFVIVSGSRLVAPWLAARDVPELELLVAFVLLALVAQIAKERVAQSAESATI